jgi:TolB-like protein/Tfp pilus assembly protein PilF
MDLRKVYSELVRRNVFRAVLAYLAVAWVLIQIASTLLPVFNAPPYLLEGLIYLLAVGLVFWTVFSWIYDLTPEGFERTSEKEHTRENREMNNRRLNAVIIGAGIAALLVLLAGSFWAGAQWKVDRKYGVNRNFRVAVLPFEDRSDSEEFGYLRESLAEDVMSELYNAPSLAVVSSQSTFKFKDTPKSVEQVSEELNADILLMGSYSIYNENLDLKIEVINGKENEVLHYSSLSGKLTQMKELINRVGERIYEGLHIADSTKLPRNKSEFHEVDIQAYKYNALGKAAMRDHTGQKLGEITRYFQAAIQIDSTYADPYIGMAEAYFFDVNRGYMSPAEASYHVKKYALKAEKLHPGSGEVSCIMGIIHILNYDFREAIPYFELALTQSPNYTLTYHWYSFALQVLGDFDRALELQKKAEALDPLDNFNEIFLALNYIFQGKTDLARQIIDNKLAIDPDHGQTLWVKAVLLSETGQYHEAYNLIVRRKLGLETGFISGFIFSKLGQKKRAEKVLENMLSRSYVPPSQIAVLLCGLEDYNGALDRIEEAFLLHDPWINYVLYTSFCDPVKNDPRYVSLMASLEDQAL